MNDVDCFGRGELFNPILGMGTSVSCVLVISHFFQLVLRPFGQPAPVAQILVSTFLLLLLALNTAFYQMFVREKGDLGLS